MDYCITEYPTWRESGLTTSEIVERISDFQRRYHNLSSKDKDFCNERYSPVKTVNFIYHMAIGELVGIQSEERIKELLGSAIEKKQQQDSPSSGYTLEEVETLSIYSAICELNMIRQEMEETGFLTVQLLCEVHSVLMKGIRSDAGEIRKTEVFTTYRDSVHMYPPPDKVEQRLYTLIDQHNIFVQAAPSNMQSVMYVTHIFKMAARLLFEFVDTHPFADGNGRMCRLLANYVLSHITPFPVGVYHSRNPERSGRKDYIEAIVRCRDNPDEGPGELAALLIEDAYWGWESFMKRAWCQENSKSSV